MSLFHVNFLTIFPEMFPGPLIYSLAGKALHKSIWSFNIFNIKDFGLTKHQKVDDEQFGGGNGLVMRADVLGTVIDHVLEQHPETVIYYPSPRGEHLTQKKVKNIIQKKNITILCGRFEGIDERVIVKYNIQEISIGDYILSGGEIPALALIDSCIRLLPGVLNNLETLKNESFEEIYQGYLEPPLYTRPSIWRDLKVPEVLLSGHHKNIHKWKVTESARITKIRRQDLIKKIISNGEKNEFYSKIRTRSN